MTTESFTCPRCGATSYNPNDIREGYCGRCHDWPTLEVFVDLETTPQEAIKAILEIDDRADPDPDA